MRDRGKTVFGVAVVGGLLALLLSRKRGTTVSVKLKYSPTDVFTVASPYGEANRWGLTLYSADTDVSLSKTIENIDGEAIFNIPADWTFPLRFWISIIYYEPGQPITVLHQAQSFSPDWPNYIDEFIPSVGNYWYNAAMGKFEKR